MTICHRWLSWAVRDFNSHAHVERDVQEMAEQVTVDISTHTLTWSVTFVGVQCPLEIKISTHTLTWSVTSMRNI